MKVTSRPVSSFISRTAHALNSSPAFTSPVGTFQNPPLRIAAGPLASCTTRTSSCSLMHTMPMPTEWLALDGRLLSPLPSHSDIMRYPGSAWWNVKPWACAAPMSSERIAGTSSHTPSRPAARHESMLEASFCENDSVEAHAATSCAETDTPL